MIGSFGDQGTEDIYNGRDTREARATLPKPLWGVAQRKLGYIEAAHTLDDLRVPPGNRLEQLQGDLAGFWSIRVNEKFRIIFRFDAGLALDVRIVDYH